MGMQRDVLRFAPAGIVRDLPPDAVAVTDFNGGSNVTFRDGIASRVRGYAPIYGTPLYDPELLANLRNPLNNFWIYAGRDGIGATDGVTHGDITPAAGWFDTTQYNQWSAAWLNSALILNQFQMEPIFWNGGLANLCEPLPGWPTGTNAQVIRASKYHLFALNVTDTNGEFPNGVLWSDAAEPGTVPQSWTPTPSNQAGSNQLSAGGGIIVDGLNMRDAMMIYKNSEIWAAQYVGGNTVFAFRKVLGGVGMLAQNCAVNYAGFHVVLTENDVVIFDGQSAKSIIDRRNKRWLFSQMDPVSYRTSYMVYNPLQNEVWIMYPSNGASYPDSAMVWCIDSDSWGERDLSSKTVAAGIVAPSTATPLWDTSLEEWDFAAAEWDQSTYVVTTETLLASVTPDLQNIDAAVTNNGVNVIANLLKSGIGLGNPESKKLIRRLYPRMAGVTGTVVQWRVGGHDQPNGDIRWSDPVNFVIGEQETVDSFATGRYLAFQISSISDQPWQLTGVDVEYSIQGKW